MAKIENIKVYPTVTPSADDLLIATDVSDNNKTVTFTVGSIGGGGGALQGLQSVLDVNHVATQNILLTGNIDALGGYLNTNTYQINGSPGLAGQVLTSAGPGAPSYWSTPSGGSSCCNINSTLLAGDTTQQSLIMNGAAQQLSLSGGTDLNISGVGTDINLSSGSNINLGANSVLTFNATATLQDGTGSEGTAGQILTVNAAGTGLEWTTGLPGGSTPSWQQTLQVGNTANNISVNLTTAPLNLDSASPIDSAGVNNFTGNTTFTYQGVATPAIIMLGGIQDSVGSLGTPKQVLSPDLLDPGKLVWVDQEGSNDLQSTLDNGNSAIQDIILQGSIDLTYGPGNGELILGGNVQINANSSTGTAGQFLTATATGVEWTSFTPGNPNLQTVLDAGNTADQNIILNGVGNNITTPLVTPTSIIASNGIGAVGDILSVLASGEIVWIPNSASGMTSWIFEGDGTTPVQQVVTDGALVQFLGGTGITTTSANTDQLTITLDNTGVVPGIYNAPSSVTVNAQGQITSITAGTSPVTYSLGSQPSGATNVELDLTDSSGIVSTVTIVAGTNVTLSDNGSNQITISAASASGMTSFFLVSDSGIGSKQEITDGINYTIDGGTYITTVQTGGLPDMLRINHDATTRTDTTSSVSPGFGTSFTVIDSVSTAATNGHVNAVNVKTINLPSSAAVTSVAVGNGLTAAPNPIINTGTIDIDYLTTNNIVLTALPWGVFVLEDDDKLMINKDSVGTVHQLTIGELKTVMGGTVTSFSASTTGTALLENVTNPTTIPDLALTWGGTASDYVNGAGNLVAISTLPNTTYDLSSVQNGFDADIKLIGSDATTDIVKIEAGNNITITDTGSNIKIDASASSGLTSFTLDGDSGPQQTIDNTNPDMTIEGGTVISSVASATNTVTLNHDAVSRTDVPTALTPSAGSVIPIVTAVSSSSEGHVTGTDVKTITWPSFVSSIGLSYLTTGGAGGAGTAAFIVGSSPIGGAGTITLTSAGTSSQYITGEGKLATFPTIPATPVYTLNSTQNGPTTVDIDLELNGSMASQISLNGGTGVTAITDVGGVITIDVSGTGTVSNFSASHAGNAFNTSVATSTTTPALSITMAGTSAQYIDGAGDLVTFPAIPTDTTNEYTISTSFSGVTDIADIDLTHSGTGGGSSSQFELEAGANMSLSVAGNKIILAANATTGLSSFTLDGDSGAQQTVDTTNPDMTIEGGTVISSVASATNTVTLNHDNVTRTNTAAGTVAPGSGGTIDVITSFTSTAQGHIDEVVTTTLELPAVGGTVTSVGLAAPSAFTVSGSPVTTSGTLTFAGAGTSAQYIDGTGALQTFPTIDNTTYTYDALQVGANVDLQLTSVPGAVVQEVKLIAGLGITLATGGTTDEVTISADNNGTVTNFNMTYANTGGTAIATQPAFVIGITDPTDNVGVTFTGDGSSSQYIDGTGSLQTFPAIDNTTYDLNTTAGATDFANINLVPSTGSTDIVQIEAGNNMSLTVDPVTNIITLEAAASTGLTAWEVAADSGVTPQTINNTDNTLTITGGALLTSKGSVTNVVEIGHDAITTATSSASSSPGHGGQVALVSALTMDGFGHVVDIETDTVTWPAASGQVDSVDFSYTTPGPTTGLVGDPAFRASVGGTATDPELDLQARGKASMYVTGEGLLAAFPTIPTQWSGWIADADVNTSPAWTINNADTLKFVGKVTTGGAGIVTDTIPSTELEIALINNGGTPNSTTFYRGDGQWAVPSASNTYDITGGTVATINPNTTLQLVENGSTIQTLKLVGAGGTQVAWDPGTKTYTINSATGSATNFDVQGSTGSTVNITQNDRLDLIGGTGIATVSDSATDSVTISNTGVTQIIAGPGIVVDPPAGTGAVTVEVGAMKTSGIYPSQNFLLNGKEIAANYPTPLPSLVDPTFCMRPRLWNPQTGGVSTTTHPADEMWPNELVSAVPGLESQVNAPIFVSPYQSSWTAQLQAMKVTMSTVPLQAGMTSIELKLYRAENCATATLANLTYVTSCVFTTFVSNRSTVCCYADLSAVPTATKTISQEEAYFIELKINGTVPAPSAGYYPFIAGRIDLHIL